MSAEALLNDLNTNNLSLYTLKILLLKMHGKDTACEMISEYCLQRKTPEARHHGMELFFMKDAKSSLLWMINENKKSTDMMDQTWGQLYEVYYLDSVGKVCETETLHRLDQIRIITHEQEIFTKLIKANLYYRTKRYTLFGSYIETCKNEIDRIEPSILKEGFMTRYKMLLFLYHWRNNELIIARKYGFQMIRESFTPERLGRIHTLLALSYLYDGYDASFYHIREAERLAIEYKIPLLLKSINHHNIPFISAYHGKTEGIHTEDIAEQAHLAVARGDRDTAIKLLERFREPSAFQLYYLGLAKEDKATLFSSYSKFVNESSHYFFARLPLKAMNKLNMEVIQ